MEKNFKVLAVKNEKDYQFVYSGLFMTEDMAHSCADELNDIYNGRMGFMVVEFKTRIDYFLNKKTEQHGSKKEESKFTGNQSGD